MMGVPERLETLVTYLVMSSGIHQKHDQKHEVPRDTPGLRVVDIERTFRSNLCKVRPES